jgi:hypothetical protein
LLAVVGLVCFDKGLAVGESIDELLAVVGSVCSDKGIAVGESVNEVLAVGELVAFNGQTTVLAAL